MKSRDWMTDAACRGLNPETWFPEHSPVPKELRGPEHLTRGQVIRMAKNICDHCPVRPACRAYAFDTDSEYGVWGALSAPERRRILGRGRRYRRAG